MRVRSYLFCVFPFEFLFALFLAVSPSGAAERESEAEKAEKFLDKFMYALEGGTILPTDLKQLRKFSSSSEEGIRTRAAGLLAQYLDEVKEEPFAGLKMLAPYVLNKDRLEQWLADINKGEQKAQLSTTKDTSRILPADFPAVSEWDLRNPEACVQISRILTSFGKYEVALQGFDKVGRNLSGIPRILAAEGGGDMLVKLQRYKQALEFYDFALKTADLFRKSALYEYDPNKILDFIVDRIRRKRVKACRLLEMEKYGPGFVMYREARTLELEKKDFIRAVVAYFKIEKECPDTVYCEAAAFYKTKCLYDLSRLEEAQKVRATILAEEQALETLQAYLREYGKTISRRVKSEREEQIREKAEEIADLERVPFGPKAVEIAHEQIEEFIEKNEHGFYRGEAYLLKGHILLEEFLDVPKATECFEHVILWIEEAQRHDEELDRFTVKPEAVSVTRPPPSEYTRNDFGFLEKDQLQPNQLFNRKSCPWYLTWLKKEAVFGAGFHFVVEKKSLEGAKFFLQLVDLDEEVHLHEENSVPSIVSRLTASSESGIVRSSREEMRGLEGKKRLACLLGDYYYSCLLHDRSKRIFRNVLDGKYGKPNLCEMAYAVGGLGDCEFFTGNYAEAAKHFAGFRNEFKRTPWAARGLFSWGQSLYAIFNSQESKDQKLRKEWEIAYKMAAEVGGDGYWGAYARLNLAVPKALSKNHREEGRAMLAQVVKRYKDAKDPLIRQFSELAQIHIDISNEGKDVYPLE